MTCRAQYYDKLDNVYFLTEGKTMEDSGLWSNYTVHMVLEIAMPFEDENGEGRNGCLATLGADSL